MLFGRKDMLGQVQDQRQILHQTLSLQQIQYLKLLAMSFNELNDYLNELYLENPLIEYKPPVVQPDTQGGSSPLELARWMFYPSRASSDDDPHEWLAPSDPVDNWEESRYNLQNFVRSQFDLSLNDSDLALLERLLLSLDSYGYLPYTTSQLSQMFNICEGPVAEAVKYLQTLDPPGIAAFDLKNSLCIQLERLGISEPGAFEMVNNHLEELAFGHFQKVAHALGLCQNRVLEIYGVIRTLIPAPPLPSEKRKPHT